jgi:ArsR family transcriptional regulator
MAKQSAAADISTTNVELALEGDQPTVFERCCALPPSLRLSHAEADDLAAMFKALGHPVRLQIVDLLSRFAGQACVCDIESQFDLSQPTISHHLKILREAGIVASEHRGLWAFYYLRPSAMDKLRGLLDSLP